MNGLLDRAIVFALRAHEGQHRKTGQRVPFVAHPLAVAFILQSMNCAETVVAAGLLHDTVEDTDTSLEDIEREFGASVAAIVAACTEPRGKWERRKQHLIDTIRNAPLEAKLVAAADKYHNLIHLQQSLETLGSAAWSRFSRGREMQGWYYRAMLDSIRHGIEEPERYPLLNHLAGLVESLFADTPPAQG